MKSLSDLRFDNTLQGDCGEIERLLTLLSRPFDDQPGMQAYAGEPPDWRRHLEVNCSS